MARWIAFVRAAVIGGMPGALIGAGSSSSHGELPWLLMAGGFLLGALIATRSPSLGALQASGSAVITVSLTTYVVVFLGLQVVPASVAWLIALALIPSWALAYVSPRSAPGGTAVRSETSSIDV